MKFRVDTSIYGWLQVNDLGDLGNQWIQVATFLGLLAGLTVSEKTMNKGSFTLKILVLLPGMMKVLHRKFGFSYETPFEPYSFSTALKGSSDASQIEKWCPCD